MALKIMILCLTFAAYLFHACKSCVHNPGTLVVCSHICNSPVQMRIAPKTLSAHLECRLHEGLEGRNLMDMSIIGCLFPQLGSWLTY